MAALQPVGLLQVGTAAGEVDVAQSQLVEPGEAQPGQRALHDVEVPVEAVRQRGVARRLTSRPGQVDAGHSQAPPVPAHDRLVGDQAIGAGGALGPGRRERLDVTLLGHGVVDEAPVDAEGGIAGAEGTPRLLVLADVDAVAEQQVLGAELPVFQLVCVARACALLRGGHVCREAWSQQRDARGADRGHHRRTRPLARLSGAHGRRGAIDVERRDRPRRRSRDRSSRRRRQDRLSRGEVDETTGQAGRGVSGGRAEHGRHVIGPRSPLETRPHRGDQGRQELRRGGSNRQCIAVGVGLDAEEATRVSSGLEDQSEPQSDGGVLAQQRDRTMEVDAAVLAVDGLRARIWNRRILPLPCDRLGDDGGLVGVGGRQPLRHGPVGVDHASRVAVRVADVHVGRGDRPRGIDRTRVTAEELVPDSRVGPGHQGQRPVHGVVARRAGAEHHLGLAEVTSQDAGPVAEPVVLDARARLQLGYDEHADHGLAGLGDPTRYRDPEQAVHPSPPPA